MADHTINIKFDQDKNDKGTGGGYYEYLISVIEKLSAAIDRIANSNSSVPNVNNKNNSFSSQAATNPLGHAAKNLNNIVDDFNKSSERSFKNIGDKIGNTLSTAIIGAVSVTTYRYLNNQTNAIMSRSGTTANFLASSLTGGANASFGGYIKSLYDIEKQRRIANTFAEAEGIGGAVGYVAGSALSKGTGGINGIGAGVAGIGAAAGKRIAANDAADTQTNLILRGAMAERAANASTSQWKTSFARWGGDTFNVGLAGHDITQGNPINTRLSREFENKYRNSQNYEGILNNIVPYTNQNPLKSNIDLDKVANNFLRAGFAAEDFSKLTMQSTQYQLITGKNIQDFSKDIEASRRRFGDAFGLDTSQNALNLLMMGYDKDTAKSIAYQSQFNPSIAGNVSNFMSMNASDFYKSKAASSIVGFDVLESERTGHLVGAKKGVREALEKELKEFNTSGEKKYGERLTVLSNGFGHTPAWVKGLLVKEAIEANDKNTIGSRNNVSPASELAKEKNALQSLMANVHDMNITAQNVMLVAGNISNLGTRTNEGAGVSGVKYLNTPSVHKGSSSPAQSPK